MNYPDGKKVLAGDKVKLWEGCYGIVVCSIDDDQYIPEYPKSEWAYLKRGVLINSDKGGLIHLIEPDEDIELIERRHS
jgi:hypothetical protein